MKKQFPGVRFSADVVEAAANCFTEFLGDGWPGGIRTVSRGSSTWDFDTLEEFLADIRTDHASHHFLLFGGSTLEYLEIGADPTGVNVAVRAPDKLSILKIMAIFERMEEASRLPESPTEPPRGQKVFIGHGRSAHWRTIKDHLTDRYKMDVTAFEVGARAGHTIRDILDEMLDEASFAIMVMTGEDETSDGGMRARQNVIHETGLFQGRLGFAKAIVVVEEGVEMYSNLDGVQQVRYPLGNVKDALAEVVATIHREFATNP